jgi:hypothetical protein
MAAWFPNAGIAFDYPVLWLHFGNFLTYIWVRLSVARKEPARFAVKVVVRKNGQAN